MGLLGRLSAWLDSLGRAQDKPTGQDPTNREVTLLMLLVGDVEFLIRRAAKASELSRPPAPGEAHPESGDPTPTDQSEAPQPADGAQAPAVSLPRVAHQQMSTRPPEPGQRPAAVSFWDDLEPTEREALRTMASLRTFAAGAKIMQEGEKADYVMVILGGRVKICTDENGAERVLAIRGLGQLVGERSALEVSVRSATVVALDLIWALVVQTKDFAAFLTAHPRVLAIVQSQVDQRRVQEPTASEYDDAPGRASTRPRSSTAAAVGAPARGPASGYPRRGPRPLNGENCTVFLTDVVRFGARTRTDTDRRLIRDVLYSMTEAALEDLGDVGSEDRGDGFLTVVPPSVSTARVMDLLLNRLLVGLEMHNSTARVSARFQLRLAVNVGPVVSDAAGVTGEAIIVAARLVEAPAFKKAVEGSTASLGVIASPFVYETAIRHGRDPDYIQVPVEVKESNTAAWMKLFGRLMSSPLAPHPSAPESYFGPLAGCGGASLEASRRSRRVRASLRLASEVASRAWARDSQRSGACSFSARTASGAPVAMKNLRSACSCAGSPFPAGTPTTTTCFRRASGQGARSASPVSSPASRRAMIRASLSPGSPCPPTCNQACCRSCQRSRTRAVGGCTISADAVTCRGSSRRHGSSTPEARARSRVRSAASASPTGW
jgi:CRP-like cAMP-binding protein